MSIRIKSLKEIEILNFLSNNLKHKSCYKKYVIYKMISKNGFMSVSYMKEIRLFERMCMSGIFTAQSEDYLFRRDVLWDVADDIMNADPIVKQKMLEIENEKNRMKKIRRHFELVPWKF